MCGNVTECCVLLSVGVNEVEQSAAASQLNQHAMQQVAVSAGSLLVSVQFIVGRHCIRLNIKLMHYHTFN